MRLQTLLFVAVPLCCVVAFAQTDWASAPLPEGPPSAKVIDLAQDHIDTGDAAESHLREADAVFSPLQDKMVLDQRKMQRSMTTQGDRQLYYAAVGYGFQVQLCRMLIAMPGCAAAELTNRQNVSQAAVDAARAGKAPIRETPRPKASVR